MSNNYAGKFVSAETAVKAVQPGDWVIMALALDFADRALAARRDELTDVKIRGGLVIRPRIEVVESDRSRKRGRRATAGTSAIMSASCRPVGSASLCR